MSEENEPFEPTTEPAADPAPTQPTVDVAEIEAMKESIAKLERKNQELLEEKSKTKQEAEKAAMEAAKKSGDMESLEKSWQQKMEATETELRNEIKAYESMMESITSGAEARKLASDLALPGHSDLLLPHIEKRLKTEFRDGKPQVRVLDKDGKVSAMTVDDLRAEITGTEVFAPILAGSRANGAGQAGKSDGGKVADKKFTDYNDQELVQLLRENPDEYKRIRDEHYGR